MIRKLLITVFSIMLLASCGGQKLVVMSFNVRQSHVKEKEPSNNWSARSGACLEMLQVRKPDLVGFQEAQFKGQWSFFRDTLSAEYGSLGIGRDDGLEKGESTGFLYKKDVLTLFDGGTFWLSETPDEPSLCFDEKYARSVTWGIFQVRKSGNKFIYMNTHLGLTDLSRREGIKLILKRAAEYNPEGLPLILSGDFNTNSRNGALDPLRETMVDSRDVAPKTDALPTYNAWGNEQKAWTIDHIWFSKDLKCFEYRTDTTPYGGHDLISDHFPISVIIKL